MIPYFLRTPLSLFTITVCSIGLFLSSCSNDHTSTEDSQPKTNESIPQKPRVIPPDFNADSAYRHVKTQADMGPRTPGSKAHDKCVTYFETTLKKYGATTIVQAGSATTFDNKAWNLKNIIGSFNPSATSRILLCTHYDSRPFADRDEKQENKSKAILGVNDGASGTGVLLEVARQLAAKQPNIGVDIIFLDLEDYGQPSGGTPEMWCLGSQYWARNPHQKNYTAKYGILLDMVGAKNALFPKEGHSVFYAGDIVSKVWGASQTAGFGNYFVNEEIGEITDDHLFINKISQIPCIDIIHYDPVKTDFFEHHHRVTDDLSNIDKATLKAVGQTLLEVIYNEQ